MSAAQIIFRDLDDGRIEVAIMATNHASKSAMLARLTLSKIGDIVDLRGIGEQLASGKRNATDIVMVMSVTDAATFVEGADTMINSAERGVQS